MALSKADEMLLEAETAEETKKALEMGANVNARDEDGMTALMKAPDEKVTDILIEAGADVNLKDNFGLTALMHMSTAKQAKRLYDAGANLEDLKHCSMLQKEQLVNFIMLLQKDKEIQAQKENLSKRQEYLAERKGEKISSPAEQTTHDSNSSAPTKPNGRDDGGR